MLEKRRRREAGWKEVVFFVRRCGGFGVRLVANDRGKRGARRPLSEKMGSVFGILKIRPSDVQTIQAVRCFLVLHCIICINREYRFS